jgi:hypothetical protein
MRRLRYRWLVVILLAAAIDFSARLALGFDMARVAVAEAVLFGGVAALMFWTARTSRLDSTPLHRLEVASAMAFGFAAVRASVWAAGARVLVANLITLGLAVAVGLGLLVRWRRVRRQRRGLHDGQEVESARQVHPPPPEVLESGGNTRTQRGLITSVKKTKQNQEGS